MDARRFERLARAAHDERGRLGASSDWQRGAVKDLFFDEIWRSTALAGSTLARPDLLALLERGIAAGERPFEEYVLTADYAAAAGYVRSSAPAGPRRPFIRAAEVVELHALAVRRSLRDTPGRWRTTTLPPFPSGMVVPPPWAVPGDIAAFVDRLAPGPPGGTEPLLWVAQSHEAFERIHPFATANGRVGRLIANLLLRRLGYPPLILRRRDAARYLDALGSADSRDPWPLATVIAGAVLAALTRLAAADPGTALRPLGELATPAERHALYKAAQRGRLRTVRRGATLLTTQVWLDAYRRERSPAGRRVPIPGSPA